MCYRSRRFCIMNDNIKATLLPDLDESFGRRCLITSTYFCHCGLSDFSTTLASNVALLHCLALLWYKLWFTSNVHDTVLQQWLRRPASMCSTLLMVSIIPHTRKHTSCVQHTTRLPLRLSVVSRHNHTRIVNEFVFKFWVDFVRKNNA